MEKNEINITDNNGIVYKFIYSENRYKLVEIDPSTYDYDSYDDYDDDSYYDDYDREFYVEYAEEPIDDIDYLFSEEDNIPFKWKVGTYLDFDEMSDIISDIKNGNLKDWDYY